MLFCEGEQGSIDQQIYRAIYEDTIMPRGGCGKVIEATKALRSDLRLHHLNARGLVDRDHRTDAEVQALTANGVGVLRVAEAENLLCTVPVLRAVAHHLSRNPDEAEQEAKEIVFAVLKTELHTQARDRAIARLTFVLNGFSPANEDRADTQAELQSYIAKNANYASLYTEALELYSILARQDYVEALRTFNHKGLYHSIAKALGVNGDTYRRILFKLLSENTPVNLEGGITSVPAILKGRRREHRTHLLHFAKQSSCNLLIPYGHWVTRRLVPFTAVSLLGDICSCPAK